MHLRVVNAKLYVVHFIKLKIKRFSGEALRFKPRAFTLRYTPEPFETGSY